MTFCDLIDRIVKSGYEHSGKLKQIKMKKFVILLSFLGFISLNLPAQNIYILGHIQVIYIGPDGVDLICHPPYDENCLTIITDPSYPIETYTVFDEEGFKTTQHKVQVVGVALNCDGLPTKVYRIREDEDAEK